MIPVLILAAGQSRRMRGTDKLLQDINGKPLLRQQIETASPIGPVFVALGPDQGKRCAVVEKTNATPLIIPEASEGIGATLKGAVPHLPAGPFMVMLADLVSLKTNDLQCVVSAMHEHPNHLIWRGATPNGDAGHPIIFANALRPAFATLTGDNGGETIVKPLKSQTYLHRFADERARFDLDTPEDWAAWRA